MSAEHPTRIVVRDAEALPELAESRHEGAVSWSLLDYLRIIWEHQLVVWAVFVLAVGMAAICAFTVTPTYEARAQLLIDPEVPNVVAFKEVLEEQPGKTDYYLTQLQILQSRTLARMTLDRLQLWDHPEFKARPDRYAAVRRYLPGVSTGDSAPATADASDTVPRLQAIGRFLQRLTIDPIRNSRLVNVRFRSSDPRLCARVVNTLVRAYIDRSTELKQTETKDALAWLDTQIEKQREVVAQQDLELQRLRDANDALALKGQQNVVFQRLSDLNEAATRAKGERIEREAAYRQLEAADITGAPLEPTRAGASPVIDELRAELWKQEREVTRLGDELGERHPDLIAARQALQDIKVRLASEIGTQRQLALRDLMAARDKEARLTGAFEVQKAQALSLDRKALEYDAMQRDASSNQQVLESLLQREKEMSIAGNLTTSNIRIVDMASVPLSSTYPRKQMILAVAGFTGLALGLVCALLVGYSDTRIKSADEIRQLLELPFLGFAPALPRRAVLNGHLLLNDGLSPEFGEALRVVRTNVALDRESSGPRVLLVTSASRGEGKSLVAMNLAIALAQARQRVLLIDGDMRQPTVHEAFSEARDPGLSDCLKDSTLVPGALRETGLPGLTILPAGAETSNPADLLGFDPVEQITRLVRREFDWTIIDSPPVGEVTDACLFAGGDVRVVFVVAADRVTRRDARAAVDRLAAADASFAGAVLSRVHTKPGQYTRTA